jgi:UDP-N-acetylglucosamine acyltransferase
MAVAPPRRHRRAQMPRIHPTAIVHPSAELADDVTIGAYCVIEGDTSIGPACVLREHALVRRYTTLGSDNLVDSFAVLGGEPQDLKFESSTVSFLRIGDRNVFREGVTISRATGEGKTTLIGNRTYWMAGAHAGHNAVVEDECVLVNGAALAGHTVLGRRAILSAHVGVHQFCWVGEGAMTQGNSAVTMHVPPFSLLANVSRIVAVNRVGLRRWPRVSDEDRRQVKQAFRLVYQSHLALGEALAKMDEHEEWGQAATTFRHFIRRVVNATPPYNRGLCPLRRHADFDLD